MGLLKDKKDAKASNEHSYVIMGLLMDKKVINA